MPHQLMLDPSLLLSRRTLGLVMESWREGELEGAILPPSFAISALHGELSPRSIQLYGETLSLVPELEEIARFVDESGFLTELPEETPRTEVPAEFDRQLARIARDDLAHRILREEWAFLISRSFLGSRLRRPFNSFLRAGAVAMEWGGKRLDEIAAKTLKIPPEEMPKALTPRKRFRAAAKWIGVGGSSAAAFVEPMSAFFIGAATNVFFLLDP